MLTLSTLLSRCYMNIAQGLIFGLLALGVFVSFRILNIADMTVDGAFACGGAICTTLVLSEINPQLALLIAMAGGCLCGMVTGLLHTKLGIPDILAGILTQFGLFTVNLLILGGPTKTINKQTYGGISTKEGGIQLKDRFLIKGSDIYRTQTTLIMLAICALIIFLLYVYLRTEHGSALRATGINQNMARAQGINTNRMKVLGLMMGDGLVALSGAMFAQFNSSGDINVGRGTIVIGLSSVIIGEVIGTAIFRKRMNLLLHLAFAVVGSVIYYMVMAFVVWLRLPQDYMKLLIAAVVAIFLAMPHLKAARAASFARTARRNAKKASSSREGDAEHA